MIFKIDKNTEEKIDKWHQEHKHNCKYYDKQYGEINPGSIGGVFSYIFTPTSIGIVTEVKCACGEKINVTDYDEW